ncbi:TetR/AcrR family transcriptional regulator [Nocardia coffeae]|uniref:TetR/AcrR family transcriptional regulator n=1 Tax=Nocardia coffeae TaxID=2873381 RepID=UPI0022A7658D|nr:TetR/AcrR family transcriptional regulator [Nocardia coffeae]
MAHSKPSAQTESASVNQRTRGLDAEQRSVRRRRKILDAAMDLFAKHGFWSTSIEHICQSAYVGTKAFYEHFESKEACYRALLDQVTAHTQQHVAERAAAVAELPWSQRSPVVIAAFVHAIADDPRVAAVGFGQAGGISPAVERQRRGYRRWAAAFLDAQWSGDPDPEPDRQRRRLALALGAIGGLFELVTDWLCHHDDGGCPDTLQSLIEDLDRYITAVDAGRAAVL